jgi:hypothetical protein
MTSRHFPPPWTVVENAEILARFSTDRRRWIAAVALVAAVVAGHVLWPAPRIEEGHNVFLPGPAAAQTSGLPADVLRVLAQQFDQRYPPEKRCSDPAKGCWRPDRTTEADGYAFSADGIFDRGAYSRRVTGINFSDPVYLRLGVINEYTYAWLVDSSDITRFARERRSLNLFDRYRNTLPLFVVYRLPAPFAGSRLCWRGTVLWETGGGRFDELTGTDTQCRDIAADDIGRRILGISIRSDVRLAISLDPTRTILLHRALEWGLTLGGVIGIHRRWIGNWVGQNDGSLPGTSSIPPLEAFGRRPP